MSALLAGLSAFRPRSAWAPCNLEAATDSIAKECFGLDLTEEQALEFAREVMRWFEWKVTEEGAPATWTGRARKAKWGRRGREARILASNRRRFAREPMLG